MIPQVRGVSSLGFRDWGLGPQGATWHAGDSRHAREPSFRKGFGIQDLDSYLLGSGFGGSLARSRGLENRVWGVLGSFIVAANYTGHPSRAPLTFNFLFTGFLLNMTRRLPTTQFQGRSF